MRLVLKSLLGLVLLVALLGAGAAAAIAWWLDRPLPLASTNAELSIEPGTTPAAVAEAWVAAGVQVPPRLLYEWFRWSGQARRIRAGSYEIDAGTSPRRLLAKMVQGDETLERVQFIEGWTVRQMRAALATAPHLKATTAQLSDVELMAELDQPGVAAEGRFFPDTYAYSRGVSDLTVLRRARRIMAERLAEAWSQRGPDSPLKSADEALILASIVEKETGLASDRARVAGVFTNRLRIGMALQTDPTVIYGLGEAFDGNLRKRDLQADTPYNTYLHPGLPPTPIALPGLASLQAAVRPESTKALYFVARGDGATVFSDSLADHNRAVNRHQRGRP